MESFLPPLPETNDVGTPAAAASGAINYPLPIPGAGNEPLPDIDFFVDDGTAAGPLSPNNVSIFESPGASELPNIFDDDDVGTAASAAAGPLSPNNDGGGAGDKSPSLDFEGFESFTGVAEDDDEDAAAANTLDRNPSAVGSGGVAVFDANDFPAGTPGSKRGANEPEPEKSHPRRVKSKKMENFTAFDPKKKPMDVLKDLHDILKGLAIDVSECTVLSLQERKTPADKAIVSELLQKHTRHTQNYMLAGISGKSNPTGYFGGYDLNLQGLLDIIAGYRAGGTTLDGILVDIKRKITDATRESQRLCTQLGISGAYSTVMPVENKFLPTIETPPNRLAVGLDFVKTAGSISYLIDVSRENTVLVLSDTGDFHLRVRDNTRFRCPDKSKAFSMNSFLPKKQFTINRIVSDSFKPAQPTYSDILAGAEAFYIYEHYFTALRTAIEFVIDDEIPFINDVGAATEAYKGALPQDYYSELEKLRYKYNKKIGSKYTLDSEFIRKKQELDARALVNVNGLRYTTLLAAAESSRVHSEEIARTLHDLYQKSVGAYCTGVGREVPQMPISMFASFADLCV